MRTFTCFVHDQGVATPALSLILAATEERARELARRELMDARRPSYVEICEGQKLLWVECA